MTRRLLRDVRMPFVSIDNLTLDPSLTSYDFLSPGPNMDWNLSGTNVYSGDTSMHLEVETASDTMVFEILDMGTSPNAPAVAWGIHIYRPVGSPISHARADISAFDDEFNIVTWTGDVTPLVEGEYVFVPGSFEPGSAAPVIPSVRMEVYLAVDAGFSQEVPVGADVYVDAVISTHGASVAEAEGRAANYFDGSTVAPPGFRTYWRGEPNASPSRMDSDETPALGVVRRNLAAYPIATEQAVLDGVWTGILGGTGGQIATVEPGPLYGVVDYFQITADGDSTSSSVSHRTFWPSRMSLDTEYASSFLAMVPRDTTATVIVEDGGQTLYSESVDLLALRWNHIEIVWQSLSLSSPDFGVGLFLADPILDGESLRMARIIHEEGTVPGPYFDGNTSPRTFWEPDMTSGMLGYS